MVRSTPHKIKNFFNACFVALSVSAIASCYAQGKPPPPGGEVAWSVGKKFEALINDEFDTEPAEALRTNLLSRANAGNFDAASRLLSSADGIDDLSFVGVCRSRRSRFALLTDTLTKTNFHVDFEPSGRDELARKCMTYVRSLTSHEYVANRPWAKSVIAPPSTVTDVIKVCIHMQKEFDLCRTTFIMLAARHRIVNDINFALIDRNRDDLVDFVEQTIGKLTANSE